MQQSDVSSTPALSGRSIALNAPRMYMAGTRDVDELSDLFQSVARQSPGLTEDSIRDDLARFSGEMLADKITRGEDWFIAVRTSGARIRAFMFAQPVDHITYKKNHLSQPMNGHWLHWIGVRAEDRGQHHASALLAWAATRDQIAQLECAIVPENAASTRLFTKAGYSHIGDAVFEGGLTYGRYRSPQYKVRL